MTFWDFIKKIQLWISVCQSSKEQKSLVKPHLSSVDKGKVEQTGAEGEEGGGARPLENQPDERDPNEGTTEDSADGTETAPDSPSKHLPDQISFFSGNPSVEIVHGIMHLYKTKWVSTAICNTQSKTLGFIFQ